MFVMFASPQQSPGGDKFLRMDAVESRQSGCLQHTVLVSSQPVYTFRIMDSIPGEILVPGAQLFTHFIFCLTSFSDCQASRQTF